MVVPIHVVIEKVVQALPSIAGSRFRSEEIFAANTITGQLMGQSYCQNFYYPNNPLENFEKTRNSIEN
ncbi:hypothetical protein [uncultured Algoriphagus sp.]|uniref:hypothetical protein n=1 Tax=uncultured Algoriphagus sp. TaxID=417365 RepID=UPI0030EE75B0|tara:strand:+ start:1637 stop:1840 length:204 start_codon:yes stop_codon:yes gene_type:complete